LKKSTKIIIVIAFLLVICAFVMFENGNYNEITYTTLGNTSIGTVEVGISGNESAPKCIALITGIHPRETLSIDPEIEAAKQFGNDDVKILHYKVTVTQNPEDYEEVSRTIIKQINESESNLDFVKYRIITRTGKVKQVRDYGHLVKNDSDADLYYVFVVEEH